jgi:hypothetical protein
LLAFLLESPWQLGSVINKQTIDSFLPKMTVLCLPCPDLSHARAELLGPSITPGQENLQRKYMMVMVMEMVMVLVRLTFRRAKSLSSAILTSPTFMISSADVVPAEAALLSF